MPSERVKTCIAGGCVLAALGVLGWTVYSRRSGQSAGFVPTVGQALHRAQSSEDPREACTAVSEIGRSSDGEAVPVLVRLLESPREAVAAAAARELGRRREGSAVQMLVKQLDRADPVVQFAAIKALEDIGAPAAVAGLQKIVGDLGPFAADAAWALGRLKDPATGRIPRAAENALIGYLASPVPRIRLGAVYGLKDGGTSRALPALEKLARNPFDGLHPAILAKPAVENKMPEPEWIAKPCREAMEAIESRSMQKGGTP